MFMATPRPHSCRSTPTGDPRPATVAPPTPAWRSPVTGRTLNRVQAADPEGGVQRRATVSPEAVNDQAAGPHHKVIAALGDVFASPDDAPEQLALPRLRAAADLRRQGWSHARITLATKLFEGASRSSRRKLACACRTHEGDSGWYVTRAVVCELSPWRAP